VTGHEFEDVPRFFI